MGRHALTCRKCSSLMEGTRGRKRADGSTYAAAYCIPCTRTSTDRYRAACLSARLLSSCRARARRRGLPFNLEAIEIPTHCPVLGVPLDAGAGPRNDRTPSVDRVEPAKGYVRGNVVVISWRANRLKSDATLEELQRLAGFYSDQRQPLP